MPQKNVSVIIRAVDKASKNIKNVGGNLSSFAKKHQRTFRKMAVAGGLVATAVGGIGVSLFNTASELELMNKKADTVLGEFRSRVEETARAVATRMGLTNQEFVNATTNIADLLVPMGFVRDEAVGMSEDMVKLAGALAEWSGGQYNAKEASEILSKAMLGETEQLKQMGIKIDQSSKAFNARIETIMKDRDVTLEQAKALDIQRQIMEKSTDAQSAYAEGAGSLADQKQRLFTQLRNVKETLATAMMPVFQAVLDKVSPLITRISEWVQENDKLAVKILLGVGALGALVAVVGTLGAVIPSIVTGFGAIITAVKAVGVAISFLIANPIGLLIAAIVGLVFVIIKNWEEIKIAFQLAYERIDDKTNGWVTRIVNIISGFWKNVFEGFKIMREGIKNLWTTFSEMFSNAWSSFWEVLLTVAKAIFGPLVERIRTRFEIWGGLVDFIGEKFTRLTDDVFGYLQEKVMGVVDSVKNAWQTVKDFFAKAKGMGKVIVEGAGNLISGKRALGGTILAGKSYLVGENGPEIVTPQSTRKVHPNGSMGGDTNINVSMGGVTVKNEADENRLVDKITRTMRRELQLYNLGVN